MGPGRTWGRGGLGVCDRASFWRVSAGSFPKRRRGPSALLRPGPQELPPRPGPGPAFVGRPPELRSVRSPCVVLAACRRSPSGPPGQFCRPCPARHTALTPAASREQKGCHTPGPGRAPASAFTALPPGALPRSETIMRPLLAHGVLPAPFSRAPPHTNPWAGSVGSAAHRFSATAPQLPPADGTAAHLPGPD